MKIVPRPTGHVPRNKIKSLWSVGAIVIFCCCFLDCAFARASDAVARGPWPERIVSINLCTDELLLRIVPAERIAAVSTHCADADISTVSDQTQRITKIKGSIEEVLAARPDLVLGGTFSNRETLQFFRRSDTPVLILDVPKSFEDIYADIREISQMTGDSEKSEAVIREMQNELADLKSRIAPAGSVRKRAVFFQSGNYVPGSGTFENAIMEAAGLVNVAAELGIKDYGNLPLENLIVAKPDVLIFTSDQKSGRTVRGEVLDHPAIKKGLPDVKIVTLPASLLNCGSPASIEAVRILVEETGAA